MVEFVFDTYLASLLLDRDFVALRNVDLIRLVVQIVAEFVVRPVVVKVPLGLEVLDELIVVGRISFLVFAGSALQLLITTELLSELDSVGGCLCFELLANYLSCS